MFKYHEIPNAYEDTTGCDGNEDVLENQDYQSHYKDYPVQDYLMSASSIQDSILCKGIWKAKPDKESKFTW